MEIHRCLFWIRSHQVTAVLYRAKRFAVMPFDGDKTIPLTPDYWDKWKAYRGFCSDDRADVCFISDEPLAESLPLSDCFCPPSESVWYIDKVQEAVTELFVYQPMKILSENGRLLLRIDNRIRKQPEKELTLTAYRVRFSEEDDSQSFSGHADKNSPEITPLIAYHLNKLKQYEENQKK